MKQSFALLALAALSGRLALASERWEVFPLAADADITTFNGTEWGAWDPAVWHVIKHEVPEPTTNGTHLLTMDDDDDCQKDGNSSYFCVIQTDETLCNLAVRERSIPAPAWKETRADGWVYTSNCDRIRGCKLLQNREGKYWSIYSDLPWTVEVSTYLNEYPKFMYGGYKCTGGIWCWGWSYILDKPHGNGWSVLVYRHTFPCP